jgi:signal transduction histidine kinase
MSLPESDPATILVVDDDPAGRYARRVQLQRAGFRVVEASTGAEALTAVKENAPSLVLLDVRLPDLDGFAVCRRIKSDPATASTIVLQTSAYYTSTTDHVRGLDYGADAYLPGDVPADLLVKAVVALLRTHQVDRENREQQERERERLRAAAERTAIALDATKEELRALAASLLTAQEDTARRIARDLHDELAQRLAAVEIQLTNLRGRSDFAAAPLDEIIGQVSALAEQVRRISHELHPTVVEHLGLGAALRHLCTECEETHGMAIRYTGDAAAGVPREVSTSVYRIAQEALRNIQKHAGDACTVVSLRCTSDELQLCVEDDGRGFDVGASRMAGGLGLISMEERARLIGGVLSVASAKGGGTKVELRLRLGGEEQRT